MVLIDFDNNATNTEDITYVKFDNNKWYSNINGQTTWNSTEITVSVQTILNGNNININVGGFGVSDIIKIVSSVNLSLQQLSLNTGVDLTNTGEIVGPTNSIYYIKLRFTGKNGSNYNINAELLSSDPFAQVQQSPPPTLADLLIANMYVPIGKLYQHFGKKYTS